MDPNTALTLLLGFGMVFAGLSALYLILLLFSWIIAVIRAAVNSDMSAVGKVVWILFCIFIPPVAVLYFLFPERNGFLRFCGWFMLLFTFGLIGFVGYGGYKASNGDFAGALEAIKNQQVPQNEIVVTPEKPFAVGQAVPAEQGIVTVPDTQTEIQPQQPVTSQTPPASAPRKFKWSVSPDENMNLLDGASALITLTVETEQGKRDVAYLQGMNSYQKVLGANPRNAEALVGRGLLKDAMQAGQGDGDFNAVVTLTTQAIGLYPDIADLYALRSRALNGLKKYGEARQDLEKAISLDPQNEDYQRSLKMLDLKTAQ